jgi:hypothetical protein
MFPDEASRQQALNAIERGMMPTSIFGWLKFLILCAVLFLAPFLVVSTFVDYVLPPFPHAELTKYLVAAVLYTAIVYVLIRRGMPHELRKRLLDAGVPVCMHCGYDLRGLPPGRDRCTECGRQLNARVRELLGHSVQTTEHSEHAEERLK